MTPTTFPPCRPTVTPRRPTVMLRYRLTGCCRQLHTSQFSRLRQQSQTLWSSLWSTRLYLVPGWIVNCFAKYVWSVGCFKYCSVKFFCLYTVICKQHSYTETRWLQTSMFYLLVSSGHAPQYLAADIHLVSEGPRRWLRSSTDRSCAVPRTHNTFGDTSFAVARPRVWNSLPAHLRDEDITYNSFRRELKTFLF